MLLVKSKDVNYCQVVRRNGIESEIVSGLLYQNRIFIRGKSYSKDRRDEANRYMRLNFSEREGKTGIILETDQELTIWYTDSQTLFAIDSEENSSDPIQNINLEYVIAAMRGIGGVKIKDRRYRLRIYSQCFIGSEAVDWMRDRFRISREEAVKLGQRLMDAEYIHHVVDDHKFKDGDLFYRFYWDEDN